VHSGDLLITGGVPEGWTPKKYRTEGCAECDWLRLNLSLYRATGDPIYLNMAQNTYFNEFSMNQFATGDFGHGKLNQDGVPEQVIVRAWWCCTLHGLRAFPDLRNSSFRVSGDELFFDFPIDSRFDSNAILAQATSNLRNNGEVIIEIHAAQKDQKLTVFKPSWADRVTLTHNGSTASGLVIDKAAAGDIIAVKYHMSLHVEAFGKSSGPARSLRFGPWLLGVSSGANPVYFSEMQAQNSFDLSTFHQVPASSKSIFQVPVANAQMRCKPAEFPEQPVQVALVPVAEQTANPPQMWQLVFPTDPAAGQLEPGAQ
jgi:hypothetical protein